MAKKPKVNTPYEEIVPLYEVEAEWEPPLFEGDYMSFSLEGDWDNPRKTVHYFVDDPLKFTVDLSQEFQDGEDVYATHLEDHGQMILTGKVAKAPVIPPPEIFKHEISEDMRTIKGVSQYNPSFKINKILIYNDRDFLVGETSINENGSFEIKLKEPLLKGNPFTIKAYNGFKYSEVVDIIPLALGDFVDPVVYKRREGVIASQNKHLFRSVYTELYPVSYKDVLDYRTTMEVGEYSRDHQLIEAKIELKTFKTLNISATLSKRVVYAQKYIEDIKTEANIFKTLEPVAELEKNVLYTQKNTSAKTHLPIQKKLTPVADMRVNIILPDEPIKGVYKEILKVEGLVVGEEHG